MTIDTAVTSVDSLAVDGNVTAGGILGLKGTPDSWVNDSSAAAIQLSGMEHFITIIIMYL